MVGFKNQSLNLNFRDGLFSIIVVALKKSCNLMVNDHIGNGTTIENHEEKIRTHLLENYLDKDEMRSAIGLSTCPLRFLVESPENYDPSTNSYVGRTDIKVASKNWFDNRNDYFIIECKRIDGTATLNNKYVTEGVFRFIGSPPKYSSYHNKNFMLGFIVKNIDVNKNLSYISEIHAKELSSSIRNNMLLKESSSLFYYCESEYINGLLLAHIFYDVSSVIA